MISRPPAAIVEQPGALRWSTADANAELLQLLQVMNSLRVFKSHLAC